MVMLPGVIIALPSGFVGRWWSDKALVLTGLAMMMLGGILTGMADGYLLMALGRLLSGVGVVLNIVVYGQDDDGLVRGGRDRYGHVHISNELAPRVCLGAGFPPGTRRPMGVACSAVCDRGSL
jgi:hypothetical protein